MRVPVDAESEQGDQSEEDRERQKTIDHALSPPLQGEGWVGMVLLARCSQRVVFAARRQRPEAPIGSRDETAEHHEQAAKPDPAHERLDVDAYRPGAVGQRFAERYIKIAEHSRIDI